MSDEIDIEISTDKSDADWQAIKAIVENEKIEGLLEIWALGKFREIYLGKPIEDVFERLMRARQKDQRVNRDIEVLTKYRDLRLNTDLTHEAIRQEIAKEHEVGEETVRKLWVHWGKFF